MRNRRPGRLTALLVVLAVMLGACSGDTDTAGQSMDAGALVEATEAPAADSGDTFAEISDSAGGEDDSARASADGEEAVSEDGEDLGSDGVDPVSLTPADIGRDIIFTAEITTAVNDVVGAGEEATRIIQGLGGFVFGQRTTGSPDPTSVLTFKVRPEDFQTALDRLGSIGDLRDQSVSADDVTERVVDLQSQITTAEASVERLRGFLENATDIDTIADLERQLLDRETTLERLRGQLRTLQDQVALATIVLRIVQASSRPEIQLVTTAYPGHDSAGAACPADANVRVTEGEPATLCFEVTNVGDTDLTDLTFSDTILDVELDDLSIVFGDPASVMQPGDSVLLAIEIEPDRDLRTRTTVTAVALDEEGDPIPTRNATITSSFVLDTVEPEGIPGFAAGLETSLQLLWNLIQLVILAIGALLPFVWVIPLVWWLRRRNAGTPTPTAPPAATEPQHEEETV